MEFINQLPPWVMYVVSAFFFAALGIAIVKGISYIDIHFRESGTVARVLTEFIDHTAQSALVALEDYLKTLDPAAQEEAVKETARKVYATLPDVLLISLSGIPMAIPIKVFISQELFVGIVLDLYKGTEGMYSKLLEDLKTQTEEWIKNDKPLPPGPKIVRTLA